MLSSSAIVFRRVQVLFNLQVYCHREIDLLRCDSKSVGKGRDGGDIDVRRDGTIGAKKRQRQRQRGK